MEEEANLFFPQSLEESQWIKSFLSGKKVQVGFKGSKNGIIYNMDNSENVGIRGITRNILTIYNIISVYKNISRQINFLTVTRCRSTTG